MPGKRRACPCSRCQDSVVSYNTWKAHAEQMAQGTRARLVTSGDCDYGAMAACSVPDQEEEAEEPEDAVGRGMALDLVELVSRGAATQSGCDGVLKIVHHRLGDVIPAALGVPTSWYKARKRTLEKGVLRHVMRDFCPTCDWLFPVEGAAVRCARCDEDTRYRSGSAKCERQAPYFDIPDLVRRMYDAKVLAGALRYGLNLAPMPQCRVSTRAMYDAYDGTLMAKLFEQPGIERPRTLVFAFSCDGVEIRKKSSYTPIALKCLSLPPKIRGLLASIWLVGCLPPKVKDYKSFLRPVVEAFARHAPGREPIRVHDASRGGAPAEVFVAIAWTVNDIRGVPTTTCGRQPPCYVGPCNMCQVVGMRPNKSPGSIIVPGAVQALGNGTHSHSYTHRTNIRTPTVLQGTQRKPSAVRTAGSLPRAQLSLPSRSCPDPSGEHTLLLFRRAALLRKVAWIQVPLHTRTWIYFHRSCFTGTRIFARCTTSRTSFQTL